MLEELLTGSKHKEQLPDDDIEQIVRVFILNQTHLGTEHMLEEAAQNRHTINHPRLLKITRRNN